MARKLNILLFGAGLIGKQVLPQYLERFNILAFVDNDKEKQHDKVMGIDVISPQDIKYMNYDFIVITSTSVEPIRNQLMSLGISKDKIKDHFFETKIARTHFPFDAILFILLIIISLYFLITNITGL